MYVCVCIKSDTKCRPEIVGRSTNCRASSEHDVIIKVVRSVHIYITIRRQIERHDHGEPL